MRSNRRSRRTRTEDEEAIQRTRRRRSRRWGDGEQRFINRRSRIRRRRGWKRSRKDDVKIRRSSDWKGKMRCWMRRSTHSCHTCIFPKAVLNCFTNSNLANSLDVSFKIIGNVILLTYFILYMSNHPRKYWQPTLIPFAIFKLLCSTYVMFRQELKAVN